jgi:ABC-type proline/glycine betaine transport system permease subunit
LGSGNFSVVDTIRFCVSIFMNPLFASFNFTTEFTVWVVFFFVALPVVIPVSVVSHWLIRRYFIASFLTPAVLLLFMLAWMPWQETTHQDHVILTYVVAMSLVVSLLIGLPFWISRRNRRAKHQEPIADESSQPRDDPKSPP